MKNNINNTKSLRWRTADIAVGAALGVACGIIFWGFNFAYGALSPVLGAVFPGLASLFHAVWYFSGPLALLIIRKPGAALYVNLVGTLAEMIIGNEYGAGFVFVSAILQGLFAELPFLLTRYRKFTVSISMVSGLCVALEYGLYLMLFRYQGVAFISPRGITHMICEVIGGVVIAGLGSWMIFRALLRTGALSQLASGRSA